MEEHLEKSSPLIIKEVHRWRDLLWDDYIDYKHQQKPSNVKSSYDSMPGKASALIAGTGDSGESSAHEAR